MASEPACSEEEHLWTIAAARLIFETSVHIQAPPNLATSVSNLIRAGIDDLGGISPVTIDYVNPERPWPHLDSLSKILFGMGKKLRARSAVYPEFINKPGFVADHLKGFVANLVDRNGYLKKSPLDADESNASGVADLSSSQKTVIDLTKKEDSSQKKSKYSERISNFPTSRPKS